MRMTKKLESDPNDLENENQTIKKTMRNRLEGSKNENQIRLILENLESDPND